VIVTPTTTVSVLGGDGSTSEWGDPIEGSDVLRSGVPAAIHEQRRVVVPEGGQQAIAVRYWTGYLPHGTEVTGAQRLRDDRTGVVYLIDHVSTPAHPARPQDMQLDLRTVE
jgi:hypothetical protein